MIIIAGYELVDAEHRDARVAAFADLVSRARQFGGCVHVAITADSVNPEQVNTVETAMCAACSASSAPPRES